MCKKIVLNNSSDLELYNKATDCSYSHQIACLTVVLCIMIYKDGQTSRDICRGRLVIQSWDVCKRGQQSTFHHLSLHLFICSPVHVYKTLGFPLDIEIVLRFAELTSLVLGTR